MKKLLTVLFITITMSASAQTKKDTVPPLKFPPDSVKVISKSDLAEFIKFLRDNFSVTYYDTAKPHDVIQQLYNWFIKEYNTPAAPKK